MFLFLLWLTVFLFCFFPFLVTFLKHTQREIDWDPQHSSEADRAWLYQKVRISPGEERYGIRGLSLHGEIVPDVESRWRLLGEACYDAPVQNDFLLLWLLKSLNKSGPHLAHPPLHYLGSALLQETGALGARDGILHSAIHGAHPRSWQMGKWHRYGRHFLYSGQISDEALPLFL